ncbi:MAG: hypothetical protein H6925_02200 [Holosporaceae bacterium]|nr:MAG: hypothetical protein H6925_02200 [Holosporaceae bacterium]
MFAANTEEMQPPQHFVRKGEEASPQETEARKATGLFLYEFLQRLNANNDMPVEGAHLIAAPTWEWVQDTDKKNPRYLLPKVDCNLENALEEILKGGHHFDCTQARVFTLLGVTRYLLGNHSSLIVESSFLERKLKEAPPESTSMKTLADFRLYLGFQGYFHEAGAITPETLAVGDVFYVSGHPDYVKRHGPYALLRGIHCVCVGFDKENQPLLMGYDPLFKAKGPQTLKEVRVYLSRAYIGETNTHNDNIIEVAKTVKAQPLQRGTVLSIKMCWHHAHKQA